MKILKFDCLIPMLQSIKKNESIHYVTWFFKAFFVMFCTQVMGIKFFLAFYHEVKNLRKTSFYLETKRRNMREEGII